MKTLDMNQVQEVNGGVAPVVVFAVAYTAPKVVAVAKAHRHYRNAVRIDRAING